MTTVDRISALSAPAVNKQCHEETVPTSATQSGERPPEKRQRVDCDKCKEGDMQAAQCYCVRCDKKLCQRHEQVIILATV